MGSDHGMRLESRIRRRKTGLTTAPGGVASLMLAEHLHRTANDFSVALAAVKIAMEMASAVASGTTATAERRRLEIQRARDRIAEAAELNRLLIPPLAADPVDASDLVGAVCTAIARTRLHAVREGLSFHGSPVLVTADRGWLLAVIAAELAGNSAKHAFGPAGGHIHVQLGEDRRGMRLLVSDDGRGAGDWSGTGRGGDIVDAAVAELGGRVARATSNSGTHVEVRVPGAAVTRGLRSIPRTGRTPYGYA